MREQEFVDQKEALLLGLRLSWLNRPVLLTAHLRSRSHSLFLLFDEGGLVRDHHVERHLLEGDLGAGQNVHHVELVGLTCFLSVREDLNPPHSLDLADDHGEVVPVDGGKGRLEIDFQALQLRLFRVLLLHRFLLERTQSSGFGLSLDTASERVVFVDDSVLFLDLLLNLEQKHLAVHLRVWMGHQDVVLWLQLLDSVEFQHLLFAVVWDVVLGCLFVDSAGH